MEVETAPPVEEKWYPLFEIAQLQATYGRTKSQEVLQQILEYVKKEKMLPFYEKLCEDFGLAPNMQIVADLGRENETTLSKMDARIEDAKENLGDIEWKNALLDKADYYNQIGDKEKAVEAYEEAEKKTVGVGGKLDNILARVRICIFFDDLPGTKKQLKLAHEEMQKGGDWERKNKLKVYEGMYKVMLRDFPAAAKLFLESVATFTATEILSFKDFVFYTVIVAMMGVSRQELKKKVIESPEILSVVHEKAHLKEFLFAFYDGVYYRWTRELVEVIDMVGEDRYLSPHLVKITKVLRLNAYRQFITSYKSVTIKLMADTFGVSCEFLEGEIYTFISQGLLNCKIDKVSMVLETQDDTANEKTNLYKQVLKDGDDLLNKMQKLAAAIDR